MAHQKTEKLSTPLEICKALAKTYSQVIINREKAGFSFTVFWVREDDYPAEAVAKAVKVFKTKSECMKAIKKLGDSTPSLAKGYTCFDYNMEKVDVEIMYDVRKLI